MWYNRFILTASIYSIYLTDVRGRARLADFGISRRLPKDQTTYHTRSAGTEGWMATETLEEDGDIRYKWSTDIQVSICVACFRFMIK